MLALAQIEQNKFDEAEQTLRDLVSTPFSGAEPDEIRQAFFALGYLLHRREQHLEAAARLEKAIEQYPQDPQVLLARYRTAQAYFQAGRQEEEKIKEADLDTARGFYQKNQNQYQEKARAHFERLAFELTDRRQSRSLSKGEEFILLESRFGIADCLRGLGRYEDAISLYEDLSQTYSHQAECLTALMQMTRCYYSLDKIADARRTIDRVQTTLDQLDEKEFRPPHSNRTEWDKWIEGARKLCQTTAVSPASAKSAKIDVEPDAPPVRKRPSRP